MLSRKPSSNTVFFAAVSHVTFPFSRLNSGVVLTTSPVAPSLTIKMLTIRILANYYEKRGSTAFSWGKIEKSRRRPRNAIIAILSS
jgi:hypothetical protein